MKLTMKNIAGLVKASLPVLLLVGGVEHIAQAMNQTLFNLPILSIAPEVVQGLAGVAITLSALASLKILKF